MLNITSQWQDPEILICCYKSILRKIRSHAETPCAQVSFRPIRPFKGYRRKTDPREAETTDKKLLGKNCRKLSSSTSLPSIKVW